MRDTLQGSDAHIDLPSSSYKPNQITSSERSSSALLALLLEAFFKLLETLVNGIPFAPLLVTFLEATGKWQPSTLLASNAPQTCYSLLNTDGAPSCDQLLALADPELKLSHLIDIALLGALRC